jgi:MFS family permease
MKDMDRIYRGWVVTASTFVILFIVFGISYSFGIFFNSLLREFGASRESISLIFSIHIFILFISGAFFGRLSDVMSPKIVIGLGIALISFGLIISSFAKEIWHLYISYGVIFALGIGAAYIPSISTMQQWFIERGGTAAGIANTGIGFGSLAIAPIAAHMNITIGWRYSFIIFGVLSLLVLTIAVLFQTQPEDISGRGVEFHFTDLFRSRPFLLLFTAILLGDISIYISIAHIVPYAIDRGVGDVMASTILGMLGGAGIAGRFGMGYLSDTLGKDKGLIICFLGMGLVIIWLIMAETYWMFMLFSLVFGFTYGGFVALLSPIAMDLFGRDNLSSIIGALFAAAGIGALIGPTMAGSLYDSFGSYMIPFTISGISSLVAAGLMISLKKSGDDCSLTPKYPES